MLLVVDSNGTVIPAATIVWGPSVSVTHRGNNVWRVSNLLPASEVDDLATVILTVTREVTATRLVTRPVTSFLTRTNTARPWVTLTATATRTQIQWVTVGSIIGGTRTHTRVLATRTRTATRLFTKVFTRSVTRPATVTATATRFLTRTNTSSATATKTVTRVVTVTAAFPFDCCCDCYLAGPGGGVLNISCNLDQIGACPAYPADCLAASGNCTYNETASDMRGPPGGKSDFCTPGFPLAVKIYLFSTDNCSIP